MKSPAKRRNVLVLVCAPALLAPAVSHMAAHLMHSASDGRVAGVAVFLTEGRANPTIQRIWEHVERNGLRGLRNRIE